MAFHTWEFDERDGWAQCQVCGEAARLNSHDLDAPCPAGADGEVG